MYEIGTAVKFETYERVFTGTVVGYPVTVKMAGTLEQVVPVKLDDDCTPKLGGFQAAYVLVHPASLYTD